ncbi:MAG TPA: hypothetical protein PLV85_10605 [Polyangiaceae bacterium]|nr:hypothetical protein [Polyangiaceae bacterium]
MTIHRAWGHKALMMQDRQDRQERNARKKGRRGVMIGYFVFVVVVIAVCTVQITTQAVGRLGGISSSTPIDCDRGIESLMAAVERARSAAATSHETETKAVALFRASLEPEWSRRGDIERACAGQPDRLEALDAVIHLGFAEEHAVRRHAIELSDIRRKAASLLRRPASPSLSSSTQRESWP